MSKLFRIAPLVGVLAACSDLGFEEFEEVTKLRTLAIQVVPPEVGPGEVARISSLTVEPGGAPIEYAWELCLFTEGPDSYYACAQDEELGVAGVPLGTTETVELPYDVVAAAIDLRAICEALGQLDLPAFVELPDCTDGLELTIRMTATADGAEHISTFPITLLFADTAAETARNRIPVAQGLLVDDALVPAEVPTPVTVPADGQLRLQLLLNTDEAETYLTGPGNEVEEREQLSVRWFSTHGRFRRGQTFFAEGIAPGTELQHNILNLGRGTTAEIGEEIGIWMVIRDTRGGVSWAHRTLQVAGIEP